MVRPISLGCYSIAMTFAGIYSMDRLLQFQLVAYKLHQSLMVNAGCLGHSHIPYNYYQVVEMRNSFFPYAPSLTRADSILSTGEGKKIVKFTYNKDLYCQLLAKDKLLGDFNREVNTKVYALIGLTLLLTATTAFAFITLRKLISTQARPLQRVRHL